MYRPAVRSSHLQIAYMSAAASTASALCEYEYNEYIKEVIRLNKEKLGWVDDATGEQKLRQDAFGNALRHAIAAAAYTSRSSSTLVQMWGVVREYSDKNRTDPFQSFDVFADILNNKYGATTYDDLKGDFNLVNQRIVDDTITRVYFGGSASISGPFIPIWIWGLGKKR